MTTVVITEDNFDQMVKQHEIVALDFWAAWCGPCKNFASIYESVAAKNVDVIFGKINVDEQHRLAEDFHIHSIPMVMILRQSIVIFAQPGVLPASELQRLIDEVKALDMAEIHKKVTEQQKKGLE